MKGKICMVTGANSGIGKVTALELARKGAHVVIVCRNEDKGNRAQQEIIIESGNELVDLLIADFKSQKSIHTMVEEYKSRFDKLHVLINNAGTSQSKRTETEDGLETTFGVNHIAPFLLTNLLLDVIKASAPARIINVSSAVHTRAKIDINNLQTKNKRFFGLSVYGMSKLANVLFTYELHHKLREEGIKNVTVNAVHPGFVRTSLGRDGGGFFRRYLFHYIIRPLIAMSPEKGAKTSIYLASSPEVETISGKYFAKKQARPSSQISYDRELQQKLWKESEKLVNF